MNELLNRDQVIDILENTPLHVTSIRLGKSIASQYGEKCREILVDAVNNVAPVEDVSRVRHGYWINHGRTTGGANILECSVCNRVRNGVSKSMYCRDCGAKMDLVSD